MEIFIVSFYSYILGSIPFGLIYTRIAGLGDVRKIGSGNIGATNVLRTGNKKLAVFTLLSDVAKGSIAVLITEKFYSEFILMIIFFSSISISLSLNLLIICLSVSIAIIS